MQVDHKRSTRLSELLVGLSVVGGGTSRVVI